MSAVVQCAEPLRDVRLQSAAERERAARAAEREAAEQAGYARGRADGEAAIREQLQAQQQMFDKLQTELFHSLRTAVPGLLADCEQNLVALTFEIAQKIVAGIEISPALVEAAVRQGLAQAGQSAEVIVYLHPDDLALLQQQQSPLLTASTAGRHLQFLSGPEISRGGCLLQTQFGRLDGRRETKLALLQKTLLP